EAVAIFGLRREAHDAGGAAVEVALRHDDLGAIPAYALDAIAPSARGLDGGLDRLCTGVHRQCGVEAADAAELLEERPEAVAVVGARRHGQPLRLRGEHCKDARMGVTEAHRRIGTHHVDVAAAFPIPEL